MVSIKDVAKHAGVAISTVSKVLNNYPNVSAATKEKVNASIRELGFVPNTIAAALSSKQAGRVALLINPVTKTQVIDEISMQYISGALHMAEEMKLDVITVFFSMLKQKSLDEVITYFKAQNIAGIIIYGMSKDDTVLHQLVQAKVFKIVLVDAPMVNTCTSTVWIDQKAAQYEVARQVVEENNCRQILYISGKKNGYVTEQRLQGIKELAKDKGFDLLIKDGEFSERKARTLTFEYGKQVDGIICASDLMAIGAVKALIEMDIFRPVCGFDGLMLMGYMEKQMYTIRQNFREISEEAVKELDRLMKGEEGKEVIMPHTLERLQYLDIIC